MDKRLFLLNQCDRIIKRFWYTFKLPQLYNMYNSRHLKTSQQIFKSEDNQPTKYYKMPPSVQTISSLGTQWADSTQTIS